MISLLARALVFAGALILARALVSFWRLIAQLPPGGVRNRWYAMIVLVALFIVGYLGYAAVFWNKHSSPLDFIVPGVFFFGACFVWLTAKLSLLTALNVVRASRLEQENLIDPLTGVFNRRYLDRRLNQEVERSLRYETPLSVLLIDIDGFKQINDTFGHQIGDQVLVELGRIVVTELREPDIFARYGGEEFMIIIPNTPLQGATDIAERIRRCIESHVFNVPIDLDGMGGIGVTVSIGVASLGGEIDSMEKLVLSADRNLYRAKHGGRNLVMNCMAGTLFATER